MWVFNQSTCVTDQPTYQHSTLNSSTSIRSILLLNRPFYSTQQSHSNGISIDRIDLILMWVFNQPTCATDRPTYQHSTLNSSTSIRSILSLNHPFYSTQQSHSNGISIDRMELILMWVFNQSTCATDQPTYQHSTLNNSTSIRSILLLNSSFYSTQQSHSNGISINRMNLILMWVFNQPTWATDWSIY